MKKQILWTMTALIVILFSIAGSQEPAPYVPIPANTEIVLWIKGDGIANDPELKTAILGNQAFERYVGLLSLKLSDIDFGVFFMPFSKSLITGKRSFNNLPPDGAIILKGPADWKNVYKSFRSKGWKEIDYSNKKLLWWSTGESFYRNPKNGECVALLQGGYLAMTGSDRFMKALLDVAGGKQPTMILDGAYKRINDEFFTNNLTTAGIYLKVTDEMRSIIKSDSSAIRSSTVKAALEYVDYVMESGISAQKNGGNYLIDGYLGMNNDNNAVIVSGLMQLGGGLANLLPKGDPNKATLSNMTISRDGRLVKAEAVMTREQIIKLISR